MVDVGDWLLLLLLLLLVVVVVAVAVAVGVVAGGCGWLVDVGDWLLLLVVVVVGCCCCCWRWLFDDFDDRQNTLCFVGAFVILYNDKCIRCLLFEYPLAHPESQTPSQHARGDVHCSTQFFKGPNLYKDQIKSDYGTSLARHKHNHVDILSVMHVTIAF